VKVLITGTSGRVGGAIHDRLAREHAVRGLDRVASARVDHLGEVTDAALLERALEGVDAVVHTAALHAPHVGPWPDEAFQRVNVDGTRVLLAAAQRRGVPHIVFTSTTALYGVGGWITEQTPPRPRTVYHRSKLAAEALLAEAAARGGPAVTVLRMSRCFPEPAPLMAAYRLHRGIDARDVAEAHALALARPQTGLRCYVVSGATPFRPEDVDRLAQDAPAVLAQRVPDLVQAFAERGWALPATIDRVYDPGRAEAELGWRARYGFDEPLRQLEAGSPEVLAPV
jgi:nucleoside-diphosphate-sugar epimerase